MNNLGLGLQLGGFLGSSTAAPVNTIPPTVQLDNPPGLVGTTASVADNGTWTNSPDSFSFQWQRNTVDIGGATSNTYTLTEADADQTLRCIVTATNAGGSTSEPSSNDVSPAVLSVPVEAAAPVISSPGSGTFLLDSVATWTANPPTILSTTQQWEESADSVSWGELVGETGTSYLGGTPGNYYRLAMTATNSQGTSSASRSNVIQYPGE